MGSEVTARASREAADWFARLGAKRVSTETLFAFREWRRIPVNAAAYADLEKVWRQAGDLAQDLEIQAATQETMDGPYADERSAPTRLWSSRRVWPVGLALSAILVTGVGVALNPPWPERSYRTTIGEERILRLEDGTRVILDTDSRLLVDFSDDSRGVRLVRGRALFDVAHDPTRPFIANAGDASVRAVGTRFSIGLEPRAVQVTLVEGRVEVRRLAADGGRWMMTPGQQFRMPPQGAPAARQVDTQAATSWTQGRLVFRDIPLAEAVREVNRYARAQVVLKDPSLQSVRVGGTFDSGDLQGFAHAVADLYDLDLEVSPSGDLVLQRHAQ